MAADRLYGPDVRQEPPRNERAGGGMVSSALGAVGVLLLSGAATWGAIVFLAEAFPAVMVVALPLMIAVPLLCGYLALRKVRASGRGFPQNAVPGAIAGALAFWSAAFWIGGSTEHSPAVIAALVWGSPLAGALVGGAVATRFGKRVGFALMISIPFLILLLIAAFISSYHG